MFDAFESEHRKLRVFRVVPMVYVVSQICPLFVKFRDLIMGIKQEDFDVYKQHNKEVLTKYNLFD